jgi:hypothetical protein
VSEYLISILLAALANWAALEVWRHGSIFTHIRARIEARPVAWWSEMLLCTYCLSHWTGLFMIAAALCPVIDFGAPELSELIAMPVLWLATVRLSNLFNDVSYGFTRTPKAPSIDGEMDALSALEELAEEPDDDGEPA